MVKKLLKANYLNKGFLFILKMWYWWWILIIVLMIVLFAVIKVRHMKYRFFAILFILFLIFVYLSVSNVVNSNKIDLKTFDGAILAGKLYFSWLGNLFHNTQSLAGNVVKMDWSTNSTSG